MTQVRRRLHRLDRRHRRPEQARAARQRPGSEVGPAEQSVATWGVGDIRQIEASLFGDFDVQMIKRSSKHIPFSWSGPDA